jgi:hypothetical protein
MVQVYTCNHKNVRWFIIDGWGTKHAFVVADFRPLPCLENAMRIISDSLLPSLKGNECSVLAELNTMMANSKRVVTNSWWMVSYSGWVMTHLRHMVSNTVRKVSTDCVIFRPICIQTTIATTHKSWTTSIDLLTWILIPTYRNQEAESQIHTNMLLTTILEETDSDN